jgi:hypothetical protein
MTVGRWTNDENDEYVTPPAETARFLEAWLAEDVLARETLRGAARRKRGLQILEPAAGDGAMLAPIRQAFPWKGVQLTACDVNPRGEGIAACDFMQLEAFAEWDLVITNPPFSKAMEFIERALQVTRRGGYVVMIGRAALLETKKRRAFWQRNMPAYTYVLSNRPKFIAGKKGTDSALYAWFVWRAGSRRRTSRLRVL